MFEPKTRRGLIVKRWVLKSGRGTVVVRRSTTYPTQIERFVCCYHPGVKTGDGGFSDTKSVDGD